MEEAADLRIVEEPKQPLAMNPKKFGMWLFMASVMMVFMALTSAYIVRRAEGNWGVFDLPNAFYITTLVIVVSSVSMQWAYFAARKDEIKNLKILISITSALGVIFLIGQFIGWIQLVEINVHLAGDPSPSGSFLYILTGLHGLHIVSAVIFLLIMLVAVFQGKVHKNALTKMEMCTTYWHFLGALWLYLLGFLILYR